MKSGNKEGRQPSVALKMGDLEWRIEKLPADPNKRANLRISGWSRAGMISIPLDLTEKELVLWLEQAIRAGVLSNDFLTDLRTEFEI